jgi:hypothetical protein
MSIPAIQPVRNQDLTRNEWVRVPGQIHLIRQESFIMAWTLPHHVVTLFFAAGDGVIERADANSSC